MYHTMYTGMDAIDYEPDASLIDGDDYYDYDDYGGSDGNNDSDEIDDWDGNSGDSDFSDDSDAASTRFPPHNLRNPKSFPSYNECSPFELYDVRDDDNEPIPPPRHWCYLGEIVESMSYPVPVLLVKGKDDKHTVITVHFDLEAHFDVKVGSTIAVLYAEKKKGLLLEYPKFVTILPCNLETLLRINDDIESETSGGSVRKCKGCGKEEGDETTLLRCSRCLSAFYCGKECQTAAWKREHKRECKVFQAVIELKRSRDWGNKDPSEWVAFGEREELRPDTPADPSHLFRPEWKEARPAVVQELQGTFTISSGELLWGQLTSILSGLTHTEHDLPTTEDRTIPGGTIFQQEYTYRAPAKVGVWKLAKVNGYGHTDRPKDAWLAYHSSCDPLELLLLARPVCWEAQKANPRVCWVHRYDWGSNCADESAAARAFANIDPATGWGAANRRQKHRDAAGDYRRKEHPDNKLWDRLQAYGGHNIFLVDAANGPQVVKLLARPSKLDAQLGDRRSSSLFGGEEDKEPFGCHLAFLGTGDWEYARLIYSEDESETFPGKKELVGFWYDEDNRYNNYEMETGRKLEEPVFEIV